ncbi:hypothetical protein OV208_39095 [Corallococcus sp. bb12-1]|uniref:hypothetical protein n=1 Tax=Corallococcus sp. bb12-1 TaxID=2996784 RepID=UPI0022701083|nr:hypothetical protein [Corallococcus sp. bb12-1]MCY1047371.1 hypothetical protein [Corallococcus sp. bb12-1]
MYLNRCEGAVTLVQGDLRQVTEMFPAGSFGHVLCNPPYRARAAGQRNLSTEKALARHEIACELPDVVCMVHPRADRPAKLVLLHAVKGGRADLTVLPSLVVHADDEHAFTDEVNAMVG